MTKDQLKGIVGRHIVLPQDFLSEHTALLFCSRCRSANASKDYPPCADCYKKSLFSPSQKVVEDMIDDLCRELLIKD